MRSFWYKESSKNLCGTNIEKLRRKENMTQRSLAVKVNLIGLMDINENVICKIEKGRRFVSDYEVKAFSKALNVKVEDLLK